MEQSTTIITPDTVNVMPAILSTRMFWRYCLNSSPHQPMSQLPLNMQAKLSPSPNLPLKFLCCSIHEKKMLLLAKCTGKWYIVCYMMSSEQYKDIHLRQGEKALSCHWRGFDLATTGFLNWLCTKAAQLTRIQGKTRQCNSISLLRRWT